MDPKRKRLYIILIIACLVLAAGILLWSNFSSPAVPAAVSSAVSSSTASPVVESPDGTYPAPAVFPANQKFDAEVLDSSAFKTLAPYQAASVSASELGRDDLFKSY